MKENGSVVYGAREDVAWETVESQGLDRNLDVLLHKGESLVGRGVYVCV